MSSELFPAVSQGQAVAIHEPTVMEIIDRLAQNPSIEAVAVIERMVALKNQQEERASKLKFMSAMARLQARLVDSGPRRLSGGLPRGPRRQGRGGN